MGKCSLESVGEGRYALVNEGPEGNSEVVSECLHSVDCANEK